MMEENVEQGEVAEEKRMESFSEQEDGQDRKSSSAKLPRPEELLYSRASWLAPLIVEWAGLFSTSRLAAGSLALTTIPRENTSAWPLLSSVTVTCWFI